MAVWVLIGFWVVVGLGVLFVAMASTRRRRQGHARPSRARTRALGVGFGAFFVGLGVAVPAAVMATNAGDDGEVSGVELTQAQIHGRVLFNEHCSTCHTLEASNAVGMVGPNLDQLRPSEELVLNAIEEGRARGQGQMPADLVTGQDARDVASYVAAVAGRAP